MVEEMEMIQVEIFSYPLLSENKKTVRYSYSSSHTQTLCQDDRESINYQLKTLIYVHQKLKEPAHFAFESLLCSFPVLCLRH